MHSPLPRLVQSNPFRKDFNLYSAIAVHVKILFGFYNKFYKHEKVYPFYFLLFGTLLFYLFERSGSIDDTRTMWRMQCGLRQFWSLFPRGYWRLLHASNSIYDLHPSW